MPKIDVSKLKPAELVYIKEIERKNLERVLKLQRTRRNNLITGGILGGLVLGIYGYSIFAVKQETFLDDCNEPETTAQ